MADMGDRTSHAPHGIECQSRRELSPCRAGGGGGGGPTSAVPVWALPWRRAIWEAPGLFYARMHSCSRVRIRRLI
jgi:hypothetical protein